MVKVIPEIGDSETTLMKLSSAVLLTIVFLFDLQSLLSIISLHATPETEQTLVQVMPRNVIEKGLQEMQTVFRQEFLVF